ncbi:MAG: hypothetical protein IPK82_29640 [Polyangiaceae bacterium]|nr:hypothetical protein [Polyangiaceae bacterium]
MNTGGFLTDPMLLQVHAASIAVGLDRRVLLSGIDPTVTAGLSNAGSVSDQILSDLRALNTLTLSDGSVPLTSWLSTAKHLSALRLQQAVFAEAMRELEKAIAAQQKPQATAPSPRPDPTPNQNKSAPQEDSAPNIENANLPTKPETPEKPTADVVIITAIKSEYDQAKQVDTGALDAWTVMPITGFDVAFRTYKSTNGQPLRIALCHSIQMGVAAASEMGGRLVDALEASCIAMSGVCAGRRGEVSPGDVIIANLVYTYDAGSLRVEYDEAGNKTERFQAEMNPVPLPDQWAQKALQFQVNSPASWIAERPATLASHCDWALSVLADDVNPLKHADFGQHKAAWPQIIDRLRELKWVTPKGLKLTDEGREHLEELLLRFGGTLPTPDPWKIHVAPMATGSNVMRDRQLFPRLSSAMRKVLGVEMEAAAIGRVAQARKIAWIVMKGVMDHADLDKDDFLKDFAARASAECLIQFLRENLTPRRIAPPPDPKGTLQIIGARSLQPHR